MHSTEIDAFFFSQNSDRPKRLDLLLMKGLNVKAPGQHVLDLLENVSIEAWDDRGVIVNYHVQDVPNLFLTWGAIHSIQQHKQ
jgi:hypothetical protein